MTTIYVVNDLVNQTVDYVCDSQATIDAGKAEGYVGVFSIGTSDNAQTLLTTNSNAWLTQQMNSGYFCVQKELVVEGGIQWHNCTLQTEQPNTDIVYQELNVPNGDWVSATGLTPALSLQNTIQQQYLTWCGLTSYETWNAWPTLPKPKTTTTGTQTI